MAKQTLHERITNLAAAADGGVVVIAAEDLMWMVKTFPPPAVTTEWGYRCPWGSYPAEDRETAATIVKNMRTAGHDAALLWRGNTDWQVEDDD